MIDGAHAPADAINLYKYLKTKKNLVPVNSLINFCSNPNDICKALYAK